MKLRVVIFGAGHHGKVVLDILQEQNYEVSGWLDDNNKLWGTMYCGLEVFGGHEFFIKSGQNDVSAIIAIGNSVHRTAIAASIRQLGVSLINAVHPSAVVARSATLGQGNCICAATVIGAHTTVGDNVIVNTGSTIDHDSVLENGTWIAPGVHSAGGIVVKQGAYVSTGAILVAGVTVGEGAVVGAGAVVTKNVPPGVLVMGVPARVVKKIDQGFNWKRLISGVA